MSPLEAKVSAANKCRAEGNRLFSILSAIFTPFVGQKVFKADGTLLKKHHEAVETLNLPYDHKLQVHRHSSDYSLAWTITARTTDEKGHSQSNSITIYIGDISNGVLTKMCTDPNYKTDYAVEEVLKAREKLKIAKKAVSDAEGELYPFGEYDN